MDTLVRARPALVTPMRTLARDHHLLYTATLAPVVIGVAVVARRPGEVGLAVTLSVAALAIQALLGVLGPRSLRQRRTAYSLVRLAVPLVYVGIAVQAIGGPALPLLALFVPIVAGAAALGAIQGWATAGFAAIVFLVPQIGELGSPAAVVLRGITLAGVALILAYGTRRIVRALEAAAREARVATIGTRRRARQIDALDELGRILAAGGRAEDLLGNAVSTIAGRFGYPFVTVYLGTDAHISLAASHGYDDALPSFDPRRGVAGRVMRTREVAFVPDVSTDQEYVPGTIRATSLITAPLLVEDRFLGVLNVETVGTRRLDETDASLVGIVASRIATFIALGVEREALVARAALFRDIDRFGRELSATRLAIDPLADVIAEAIATVVRTDVVAVTLLDRASGRFTFRAVHGQPPEVIGREVLPGEGLAGRAIRERTEVVDRMLSPERFPASVRELALTPFSTGIGLPLVRDGVVIGALTIGRADIGDPFTDLEIEGLKLVASSAALAIANAMLHAEVAELAVRDPLTGLYNRRHFDEALDRVLATLQRDRLRGSRPVSAIIFDLDRFGSFNKEHGHQVGDQVLKLFANVLANRFRAGDLVARLGGEEFVAVLDGADREAAIAIADDGRASLATKSVRAEDGALLRVTVSAGCAQVDPADPTREALLRMADVALFMAKRAGRDRVVAA